MAAELADTLRALPDDALGALLRLRPDLLTPVPADTTVLAARVQSTVSVARALDGLDQFTLEVLDGLRLLPEPSLAGVVALANNHAGVPDAVNRLRARFLVWGEVEALRLAPAIEEVSSPFPAGLGRPASELSPEVAQLMSDPAKMRRTLLSAPPAARAVLDRLAEGPPVGMMSTPTEPVSWLLEHRLLVEVSQGAVELPRELGLLLRRDAGPLGPLHPSPPEIAATGCDQAEVDQFGAGQAMNAVRHTQDLLEALADDPGQVLRSGGMGVVPWRRLAKATGLSEQDAALFLEVAHAAGLVGELETSTEVTIIPTAAYDGWRQAPLAQRWALLANAWLAMTRQPALAGRRDEKDRTMTVLSPQLERSAAPSVRRAILTALADRPGCAPTPDELIEVIRWRAPRRMRGREGVYRDAIREASTLGLTGSGKTAKGGESPLDRGDGAGGTEARPPRPRDTVALTSYGQALLAAFDEVLDDDPLGLRPEATLPPDETPAVKALSDLLPPPVDHMLVQADLTVVVPGPAEPSLAAELDLVADHESGGGASVYRITPAGVRRALDAGYPAQDLHNLFQRRSRTPVPQALTYLIDDVARTHGGLRTGAAGAYLRSDDESLITTALADRRLADLRLRRLAPTVLITPFTPGRMLESLREAGYSPVPEDASGFAVLTKPRVRRAPSRTPASPQPDFTVSPAGVLAAVEELRRGDARMRAARRAPAEVRAAAGQPMSSLTAVQAHSQALAVLQQAIRDKARVWVGYVDAHGASVSRLVRPVSIGAGYLRAEDDRTQTLHTFALHRITAAAPPDQPD